MPVLAMAGMLLMASCGVSDEDGNDLERDNACYISSVKFNTLRRQVTVKASDGVTDSTYYSTFTASRWVFSIDHRNLLVENRDSLPYNTDLSKCVLKLGYIGAIAYYRASDAWEDDPWITYNGTDSVDLRKPLYIRVLASDRTERRYTLRANVHTMHGDSLQWTTVQSEHAIDGTYPMKAMGWDGKMAVLVNDSVSDSKVVMWMTHEATNHGEWMRQATDLPVNTDVTSLACDDAAGRLYVNTGDGALYASSDGVAWDLLCRQEGLRLVGISRDYIYIMVKGALYSASPAGLVWKAEQLDDEPSLLPANELAFITYSDRENLTRMLFAGNRNAGDDAEAEEDTTAVVWSKAWTAFETEENEKWMHYTRTWDNNRQLPMLEHLNILYYDSKLTAIGGKSRNGKVEALENFYVSEDNGLTWWPLLDVLPPAELKGVDGYVASGVDSDRFLWLMAGGKVFRGRINRLGFDRPDKE